MSSMKSQVFFENAEKLFLDALKNGKLDHFLSQYQSFCLQLSSSLSMALLSPDTAAKCILSIQRIRNMSEVLVKIRSTGEMLKEKALSETKMILSSAAGHAACSQDKQDSLNSQFLRRWFLEHTDHPFPSTAIKEDLAEITNAKLKDLESRDELPQYGPQSAVKPISKNQCQLWFINTRRRSTWTEFYRKYAFSDKSTMAKLVSILRNESENTSGRTKALTRLLAYGEDGRTTEWFGETLKERVASCQDHWTKIMEWLEQRPHEQQSDWLSQAIDEATSEYNQMRKGKRDQRRKERELKLKTADDHRPNNSDQLHSRKRAKRSKTNDGDAKSLTRNHRSLDGARKIARRPSTMVNSTDKDRNVSGSSTSTLDTSCSSISTNTYATASSPLASYGKGQEFLKLKNRNYLESLYNEPKTLSSNSGYKTNQIIASPLQFGDDELGDDDGEFELDNYEEANQGASPWH